MVDTQMRGAVGLTHTEAGITRCQPRFRLVEMAGIEPASEEFDQGLLQA
jgi:hypothetical protein